MTIKPICRALAVVVLFLLVAPAWSRAQKPPPSYGRGMAEVRALLKGRQFQEALTILRRLAEAHPGRKNVLFLIGLTVIEASRRPGVAEADREALLDEAIATLRAMLIDQPGLLRVRLELARAFFLKGEDNLSREHFERVLAGNPPPPVVANVRRFLAQIRARRRWNMHFGFALAPDTNIGASSNERTIYIGGLPFRRDEEELTRSGVGVSVWTGGEYQHPLGDRLRLRAGADISRREHTGGEFDQMFVSVHAGPRLLAGQNTEMSLLASARHRWTANEPDHYELGTRVEGRQRLGRRLTVNAGASWHDRRYRTRTYLDGLSLGFWLGGSWVITPVLRAEASGGYGRERPKTEKWRHARRWVQAGLSVALPRGFTLGGSAELRRTAYEGDWGFYTPGGVPRKDYTRSLRASVHNRALTLFGFSPQVSLVHEVRKTNAQIYDYKRTGGELRFVRQF